MKKGFLLSLSKSDQPILSDSDNSKEKESKSKNINLKKKVVVPKLNLKTGERLLSEDFTNGAEDVPISVVNGVDKEEMPNVDYQISRFAEIPRIGLELAKAQEICSSCDCKDDCSDPTKCKCLIKSENRYYELGQFNDLTHPKLTYYKNGLLNDKIFSGIYECNKKCKCQEREESCKNRVAQSRVSVPLQIFKTAQIGWGIRCLVEIPKGTFISTYSGKVLTDELILKSRLENEHGKYPDEYIVYLSDIVTAVNSSQNLSVPKKNVYRAARNNPTT